MENNLLDKYVTFYKLAKTRLDNHEKYTEFQQFQASWILENLLKEYDLKNAIVLDLGSGMGGYTKEIAKNSKFAFSLDLNILNRHKEANILQIKGDAVYLPFKESSFDFIFCASLVEHIPNQYRLLAEIFRVLKRGHTCYLSFPPFYSPVGGHQFKPYHLLGERMAVALSRRISGVDARDFETSFGNWGLYPTTIFKAVKLIRENGFKIDKTSTRFSPINFAKIPYLREFLTWHVEFLIRKGDEAN